MGQNNQKWDKITEAFFECPNQSFTIRELSKYTKLPKSTAQRYLKILKKESIVDKENKFVVTHYTKFLKTSFIIKKLFQSGLINYLENAYVPSTIIVFGSARKGEYVEESDIDLFIETTKNNPLTLSQFEKKIKHKVHIFTNSDINKLPNELFNNVINGIKLTGYVKVK